MAAASFSLPEEHSNLRPGSVSIVVCSVLMQLRQAGRMSFAFVLHVSLADSTFRDPVSYLAFKPAEVEILCKTLDINDGKELGGTFYSSGFARFRGSGLDRQTWNGDEHFCPVWTTQKAVRCRSVSQRTSVTACTCISSQHNRCLNCRSFEQSLKSQRPCGRSEAYRNVFGSATTSIRWTGSKWSRPTPTKRYF